MAAAETQAAPGLPAYETVLSPHNLPSLRSNHGDYVDQTSTGWMRPTHVDTPPEEMRNRFARDGYIWVKNVIPREDVYDMREHYFSQFVQTNMLHPSHSPRAGIFNPSSDPLSHQGIGGTPEATTNALLDAAHATPTYRKFLTHASLRAFIRLFTGWTRELLLDRAMLRHNCPSSPSTGIHYDQLFLRGGGREEFLTAWIPIGDCAPAGGGLMYLENSTELGRALETEFLKKAKDLSKEERIDAFNQFMSKDGFISHDAQEFRETYNGGKGRWLVGDYEAGDVVFHNPWMIHAATRNEDKEGRIRLASDVRFYEEGVEIDQRWMKVWTHDDGL